MHPALRHTHIWQSHVINRTRDSFTSSNDLSLKQNDLSFPADIEKLAITVLMQGLLAGPGHQQFAVFQYVQNLFGTHLFLKLVAALLLRSLASLFYGGSYHLFQASQIGCSAGDENHAWHGPSSDEKVVNLRKKPGDPRQPMVPSSVHHQMEVS